MGSVKIYSMGGSVKIYSIVVDDPYGTNPHAIRVKTRGPARMRMLDIL